MNGIPTFQHYQENVHPMYFTPEQRQSLDMVRDGIMNAVNAQFLEATTLNVTTFELTRHFSQTTAPMFRHIPKEDVDSPAGWVTGLTAVRSYFDLLGLYWKRGIRVRRPALVVDPVNRTCQYMLDIEWTWCKPKPGLEGWQEIVECNQMYDWEFKVVKAEYLTLSGRDTCWSVRSKSLINAASGGMVRDITPAAIPSVHVVSRQAKPVEQESFTNIDAFFFPGR